MATKKKTAAKGAPCAIRTAGDPALDREQLHSMLLQRRFEEKVGEAYALGKIGGFCHLYIGQEAVSTGIIGQLRSDDFQVNLLRKRSRNDLSRYDGIHAIQPLRTRIDIDGLALSEFWGEVEAHFTA